MSAKLSERGLGEINFRLGFLTGNVLPRTCHVNPRFLSDGAVVPWGRMFGVREKIFM